MKGGGYMHMMHVGRSIGRTLYTALTIILSVFLFFVTWLVFAIFGWVPAPIDISPPEHGQRLESNHAISITR